MSKSLSVSNQTTKSPSSAVIASLLKLKESWPSAIVARNEINKFSGGLLQPRHMSNLDSRGEGPLKITIGRRVGYPVDNLIEWMIDRAA